MKVATLVAPLETRVKFQLVLNTVNAIDPTSITDENEMVKAIENSKAMHQKANAAIDAVFAEAKKVYEDMSVLQMSPIDMSIADGSMTYLVTISFKSQKQADDFMVVLKGLTEKHEMSISKSYELDLIGPGNQKIKSITRKLS